MSKKYYVERKAENLWLVAAEDGSDAKEFYEQSRAIRHCSEMNSNHCTAPLLARIAELEAMVGAAPKSQFFSFCPANIEYETHSTLEAAKKAAQESLDYYHDNSDDGWDEEVFRIGYGVLLGGAYLASERPMDDEEKARFGVDGEIWDVQLVDFKDREDQGGAA